MARSGSAWSVKGIDSETRSIARARAGHSELTIGAWIDQAILAHAGQAPEAGQNTGPPRVPPRAQDDSGLITSTSVPPGDSIDHQALLDLIDGELAASRARLDESLRPLGFALKDLALKLVAAESLSRGGAARPTSQRPEIGSDPDSKETSSTNPPGIKTWPDPPTGSLAPPIEPIGFQTAPGHGVPPPPTGDLDTIITSIQPQPANLNRLDAHAASAATQSRDLDENRVRPSAVPPTGALGLVDPATMPAPPAENREPTHIEPEGGFDLSPEVHIPTLTQAPELGPSPAPSEEDTGDVRFTGLQDGFESDPDLAVVEARAETSRKTKRFLRIAASLFPFLILASAGAVYLLADQLGIGAQRDRITSTISNHVRGSEKTVVDSYHAAVGQLKSLVGDKSESPIDSVQTNPDDNASQDIVSPLTVDAKKAVTPAITPGSSSPNNAKSPAPTRPRRSAKVTKDQNSNSASTNQPSDDPPVAHLGYQNTEKALKPAAKPALPLVPNTSRKRPLPIPDKALATIAPSREVKQRTPLASLPRAPKLKSQSLNNETFTLKNTIKALQQQARAGDATAQHELARRLIEGDGIEQDFGDGSDWFREAAIQGMANAQYNLGVLYERGLGVTKDDVRALLWYHSAAEQSHPLAQYNLGIFYLQGRGIPLSYAEAVRWFRAASDQGVAKATYNLAVLTEDGLGVRPDKSKAMELYEKAASAGHHEALNRLTLLRDPNTGKTKPATFEDTANTQGEGGSTGTTVADIQAVLRRDGIYSGRIDGVAGPKTRTAIREYQRRNALPITGIPSILLLDYMKTSKTNAHSEGRDSG